MAEWDRWMDQGKLAENCFFCKTFSPGCTLYGSYAADDIKKVFIGMSFTACPSCSSDKEELFNKLDNAKKELLADIQ